MHSIAGSVVVFRLRVKAACKRLGGCRCSSGKVPRAHPVACAGNGVGCVAGEAGAGLMVGCVAVFTGEQSNVGFNRAVAASTGDSVAVSRVVTEGEEGY